MGIFTGPFIVVVGIFILLLPYADFAPEFLNFCVISGTSMILVAIGVIIILVGAYISHRPRFFPPR